MKHLKRILVTGTVLLLIGLTSTAQKNKLPVREWSLSSEKPLVFYISGDGGFTDFSSSLCNLINKSGYSITFFNSYTYFWNKKTPAQTANDIAAYVEKQCSKRKNQQFILIGYSFGAEIAPFVINNLPDTVKKKLVSTVLLSPSSSTDFEVHVWDMMGGKKKRSMDVVAEINKMGQQKTTTIFGNKENDFPVSQVKLKNYKNENLPGGHRFEGNTDEVVKTMVKYF